MWYLKHALFPNLATVLKGFICPLCKSKEFTFMDGVVLDGKMIVNKETKHHIERKINIEDNKVELRMSAQRINTWAISDLTSLQHREASVPFDGLDLYCYCKNYTQIIEWINITKFIDESKQFIDEICLSIEIFTNGEYQITKYIDECKTVFRKNDKLIVSVDEIYDIDDKSINEVIKKLKIYGVFS